MKAKIEIFDGYGQDGSIIFKAATTCYRSEEKTQRTAGDFIKMLKANGHMSMLEFSWFPVLMDFSSVVECNKQYNLILELKLKHIDFYKYGLFKIIMYGNGRAWLDFFNYELDERYLHLLVHISKALNTVNSELFEEPFFNLKIKNIAECLNKDHYYKKIKYPVIEQWAAVKFSNVSRGFTHELVRHRTMSFAQASTRYIDNSNFDCIMPDIDALYPDMTDEQKEKMLRIFAGVKNNLNLDYNYLLDHGIKKHDARQILPIGIANEICVAGTIKNWKHVFELRCSPAAHWEIREVMVELQKEFKERGLLE